MVIESGKRKSALYSLCLISWGVNMPSSLTALGGQEEGGLRAEDIYLCADPLEKLQANLHICILVYMLMLQGS